MIVRFADVVTKQIIENWADDRDWDAVEKLEDHFAESTGWEHPREFGLDSKGSLFFDGRSERPN